MESGLSCLSSKLMSFDPSLAPGLITGSPGDAMAADGVQLSMPALRFSHSGTIRAA
jgi:hypothetical protein